MRKLPLGRSLSGALALTMVLLQVTGVSASAAEILAEENEADSKTKQASTVTATETKKTAKHTKARCKTW